MFNPLRNLIKRKLEAEQARQALLQVVNEATREGRCVILSESPAGTRVVVIGRPLYERQIENILKG